MAVKGTDELTCSAVRSSNHSTGLVLFQKMSFENRLYFPITEEVYSISR